MHTPSIEEIATGIPPHILFKNIEQHPYSFFLDSAVARGKLSRYSFMGSDPFLVFKSKKDSITLEWKDGRTENIKAKMQ